MRFDSLCQPTGATHTGSQGWTKFRVCLQRWSYFGTTLLGYALGEQWNAWLGSVHVHMICPVMAAGLVLASVVVDLTGAAQPALLYLVPGVLLPLLLKAFVQVQPLVQNVYCQVVCLCVCVYRLLLFFPAHRVISEQCGMVRTSAPSPRGISTWGKSCHTEHLSHWLLFN